MSRWSWAFVFVVVAAMIAAVAMAETGPSRCPETEVNLNVVNAGLPEVLALMSKTTGRRFIVGRDVSSITITILSPQPVCPNEAYEAFLSALAAQGLTVVKRGRYHVVMTVAQAVRSPLPLVVSPESGR